MLVMQALQPPAVLLEVGEPLYQPTYRVCYIALYLLVDPRINC